MSRPRLSYANLVSTLALFVALTGASAYAVTRLPDRSVGEFQLRPGAVTAQKIRKNAVTAPKIKAAAVKQGKIAKGAVVAAKLALGSVSNSSLQEGSVTNSKLAPEAVTGDKALESTFSKVPSASRADSATFADSANPEAFGFVSKEAVLDQNLSRGIAQAKDGSLGGIYCVTAQAFNPKGAQATLRYATSNTATAYVVIGGTADCPAPAVEVQTFEDGTRTRAAFYVVLYR